jgi:hypothetical protein
VNTRFVPRILRACRALPRRGLPRGPLLALLVATAMALGFASGCSLDNALVGGTCATGYEQCGQRCVRLASDPDNCGVCGRACPSGVACTGGVCGGLLDATAVDPTDAPAGDASEAATGEDGRSPDGADGTDGADGGNVATGDSASAEDSSAETATGDAAVGDGSAGDAAGDASGLVDPGPNEAGLGEGDSGSPDAADAGANDASGPDSGAVDSGSEGAPVDSGAEVEAGNSNDSGDPCAPLISCGGQCVDLTVDPLNCGACNVVCASQLCANSHCVGAASGGVVYIGHDYATTSAGTAQARVLSNAVFVPQSNPLHVLSYERYASAGAVSHVDAILNGVATQLGRTLSIRSTTNDDDVPTQLALPAYDVLLVHDQPAATDGTLAALGAYWAPTLATFTLGGGVVVVLDGGTGIGQMNAFSSGTGLLQVTAHAGVAVRTPLDVTSRLDVVGIGVVSPYGAGQNSVSLTTEPNAGNVVYVVELSSDAGASGPVVVHKAFQ